MRNVSDHALRGLHRQSRWCGVYGFTLIEVMVSVGIMGLVMTLIWSSTAQTLNSKERIERRDAIFHAGLVGLRKISDDISLAFLASTKRAAKSGSSEEVTTEPFKTFFIGDDRGSQDSLRFTSLSHLRLMRNAKQSDQCRISYEVVPNEENTGLFNIVRREQAWLGTTDEVEGRAFTMVEGLKKFELEYYDERKGDWGKEWSTEKVDWKGRLPMAVRVLLEFEDPEDDTRTIPLSTAVMLPLAAGPITP